jgi:hypothetical protein
MANALEGEIALEAGGKAYTAVLDARTIATVEQRLDRGMGELLPDLLRGRVQYVHLFLWAGLQRHHRGITEDQVFEIIHGLGVRLAGQKVGEALRWILPDAEAAEGEADPPAAPGAGTGSD